MNDKEQNVRHIVLTGGPCAGKTTALAYLTERLSNIGFRVVVVPEAATLLIQSGIAPWTVGLNNFQRRVFELIRSLENITEKSLESFPEKRIVFIHDRGIPDGRAYLNDDEFSRILLEYSTNIVEMSEERYDAVFHLVTAAQGAEKFYTYENNVTRRETIEEARELDRRTMSSWVGHPHLRIIGNKTGFEEKMKRLYREVCVVLEIPAPIEIERKFLIEPFDLALFVPLRQSVDIEQIYLISTKSNEELRIRKRGRDGSYAYYRTTKYVLGDGERAETERRIDKREYVRDTQFQIPKTRIICKERICFVYEDQYFEYDRFSDPPNLHMLEIELTDLNDTISIPEFIHVVREVTDDPAYKNSALARCD